MIDDRTFDRHDEDGSERELVDQICADVATTPGDAEALVRHGLGIRAPLLHGEARERVVRAALARLVGLGELDILLADPTVDEILVNRGHEVWVEVDGRLRRAGTIEESAVGVILERVLAPLGRRLDRSDPIVDARLPDGSRVCAVVAPVAVDGTTMALRRTRRRPIPLDAFCDAEVRTLLAEVVQRRCNVVVSGATSSGKTTLLAALVELVGTTERIVVLEDTTELEIAHGHVVRLEARRPTPDGPAPVGLDHLVRTALRLRPDRLVVGEVRGDEVLALVQAMNTGHDGSLSTCHANGPEDAIGRLESLVLAAAPGWPLAAVRSHLGRSVDVVVHVARTSSAARRVTDVVEVEHGEDRPRLRPVVRSGVVVNPLETGRTSW